MSDPYRRAEDLIRSGAWTINAEQGHITSARTGGPIGWTSPKGYIRLSVAFPDGKVRSIPAHRVIWEHTHGPITNPALQINHINGDKADNRIDNLELVLPAINIRHARDTGLNPLLQNSKITATDVVCIRYAYAGGATQTSLATRYGISQTEVSNIVRGTTWQTLPGPRKTPRPRRRTNSNCKICEMEPAKAKGRCHACACYWRRTGTERPQPLAHAAYDRWLANV